MKTEFSGDIMAVRDVEDCIRLTRKYTQGIFKKPVDNLMQGDGFPCRVLKLYYEVYPDLDVGFDMKASDAWAWIWGDVLHIDVYFYYNYVTNKGKAIIYGNDGVINALREGIPGFGEALDKLVVVNGKNGLN